MVSRRSFLKTSLAAALAGGTLLDKANAALKKMKVTRVRFYENPESRPIFNQSMHVITVETDAGMTGIGEGGTPDLVKQCAELIVGQDPARIEHLWQHMYRAYFYPPSREKIHAQGGLDLALWDLKGKALDVPVWQLLGGRTRDYVECYSTGFPNKGSLRETARACMQAGFRAFRTGLAGSGENGAVFDNRRMVDRTVEECKQIREGVGPDGDWAIDYHTRVDYADAVRLSQALEPLKPFFCEDLVRSENRGVYRTLRQQVKVPIAVGEHFADKWEINELVEQNLIDFSRVTLPNCGGITEFMKLAALCETHYVGLIPHFTGPIAQTALVHALCAASGPALMEVRGDGSWKLPHLPKAFDFKDGKIWPNERPGLGVEFDASKLKLVAEYNRYSQPIPLYKRPDGSITNW
jgi:L-alanine-DL-glutamate epimerase-like enolase superfamily enzyme